MIYYLRANKLDEFSCQKASYCTEEKLSSLIAKRLVFISSFGSVFFFFFFFQSSNHLVAPNAKTVLSMFLSANGTITTVIVNLDSMESTVTEKVGETV